MPDGWDSSFNRDTDWGWGTGKGGDWKPMEGAPPDQKGQENRFEYTPPTMGDIQQAMMFDAGNIQGMFNEDYQKKAGALDFQQARTGELATNKRNEAEFGRAQGEADIYARLANAQRDIDVAANQATQKLDKHFKEISGDFDSAKQYAKGTATKVWQVGAKAMADFKSTVADQMTDYNASSMEANRVAKEEMASTLREQGASPQEIQMQMKKMDIQGSVERTQTLARMRTDEEKARRTLQKDYDYMGAQTQSMMADVVGRLTSDEADFTVQMDDLRSRTEEWRAGLKTQASIAAFTSNKDLRIASEQMKSGAYDMEMLGETENARMWQGLDQAYAPLSSMIMDLFGLHVGLEDRYYGGMMNMMGGSWATLGAANSALGNVVTART